MSAKLGSLWSGASKDSVESECSDSPQHGSTQEVDSLNKVDGSSAAIKKSENVSIDHDMTEIVKSQTSSGMFEITEDDWEKSVFKAYLGCFQEIQESCPDGTQLNSWLTSLAMKILEIQMIQKKDLWELVAEKSKKYLLKQLLNNEQEYNKLQEKAEAYVTKHKGSK